jgi:hypothetical protein
MIKFIQPNSENPFGRLEVTIGENSQEFVVYAQIVDEMKSMEPKLNLKKILIN